MYALLLKKQEPEGRLESGLVKLQLEYWEIAPVERMVDKLMVVSGAPSRQIFRTASTSPARSLEPIPEGRYKLGDYDAEFGLNWASGHRDNYTGSFGTGLGPVWCGIHPLSGLQTSREALGIHLDANARTAPGSAGCIAIPDQSSLIHLVGWFTKDKWPRYLVVDWGLGTVTARFPAWMKGK